jgi:hypothetical protein
MKLKIDAEQTTDFEKGREAEKNRIVGIINSLSMESSRVSLGSLIWTRPLLDMIDSED